MPGDACHVGAVPHGIGVCVFFLDGGSRSVGAGGGLPLSSFPPPAAPLHSGRAGALGSSLPWRHRRVHSALPLASDAAAAALTAGLPAPCFLHAQRGWGVGQRKRDRGRGRRVDGGRGEERDRLWYGGGGGSEDLCARTPPLLLPVPPYFWSSPSPSPSLPPPRVHFCSPHVYSSHVLALVPCVLRAGLGHRCRRLPAPYPALASRRGVIAVVCRLGAAALAEGEGRGSETQRGPPTPHLPPPTCDAAPCSARARAPAHRVWAATPRAGATVVDR